MDWIKDLKPELKSSVSPVYDSDFLPLGLFFDWYQRAAARSPEEIGLAIERENGLTSVWTGRLLPLTAKNWPLTLTFVERLIKFLLWQKGGFQIYFYGPEAIYQEIKITIHYQDGGLLMLI